MPEERFDALIRTLLAVGGGALAVSTLLFLNSDSLELDAGLVGALRLAWLALFYLLAACAGARFLALLGPPAGLLGSLRRVLVGSALAAFVLGLGALAYVSVVAIADVNAADSSQDEGDSAI